jgi:purine-nucleoside phosphorylase
MMSNYELVEQARNNLLDRVGAVPHFVLITGSGLSAVDEILRDTVRIHYASIPHFRVPTVAGHRGQVVFGKIDGLNVMVFEGRTHFYETGSMADVTFCTRVIARTGASTLLLTNAAGAVNPAVRPGQLVLVSDHLNFLGANPLIGVNEDRWGPRFVDQTEVYDKELRATLHQAATYCGLTTSEGVYAAVPGPTYETPAETRFLRSAGADVVGMSTVPEAIVARHMGMKVAAISLITNVAAVPDGGTIQHDDVLSMTTQMNADVGMLLQRFFEAREFSLTQV